MSVQFGRWDFEGKPPDPDYMGKVSAFLAPYGPDGSNSPDGSGVYSESGIKILFCGFCTTNESHCEIQPHVSSSGAVIAWDGRLDNRGDLTSVLHEYLDTGCTDVEMVAAAYEAWGADCFARLIGDWALSIWNPADQSLILAKDPIGTRHLYYTIDSNKAEWCTLLDPLVLFGGKAFSICEEYVAGWFSTGFPAANLTPYSGIHAVAPSSVVLLRPGRSIVSKYWDFDPAKKIRYRTDAEYEEHFRSALATAVQRRLRSNRPILAELSGGMDSSSIVCMADTVIARGAAETRRVDTISWYDDSNDRIELDTNEYAYFSKVEEKRGRTGFHINTAPLRASRSQRFHECDFETDRFAATPVSNRGLSELFRRYAAYLRSHGYRVTLSGIGGDSVTGGGVPTPTPELQDLLATARFFRFTRQLNAWAVKMRKSRFAVIFEAIGGFFLPNSIEVSKAMPSPPWFAPSFVRRNRAALCGYVSRVRLFGSLPSFQDNLASLEYLRRLLGTWTLHPELLREVRFPYLDRDLLEFLFALPREQVVGVGQRRSLMKRALVGIVPDELLKRRRKAFVSQESQKDDSAEWARLVEMSHELVANGWGIIDSGRFVEALQKAVWNEETATGSLIRTVMMLAWLRHLSMREALTGPMCRKRRTYGLGQAAEKPRLLAQSKSSAS